MFLALVISSSFLAILINHRLLTHLDLPAFLVQMAVLVQTAGLVQTVALVQMAVLAQMADLVQTAALVQMAVLAQKVALAQKVGLVQTAGLDFLAALCQQILPDQEECPYHSQPPEEQKSLEKRGVISS